MFNQTITFLNLNLDFRALKNNLPSIAILISIISLIVAYKSYKINKARITLDSLAISRDFSVGISYMNEIANLIHSLDIKGPGYVTKTNILNDGNVFKKILTIIENNYYDLLKANFTAPTIKSLKASIVNVQKLFQDYIENTSIENRNKICLEYSSIYFQIFILRPVIVPKATTEKYPDDLEKHDKFLDYRKGVSNIKELFDM